MRKYYYLSEISEIPKTNRRRIKFENPYNYITLKFGLKSFMHSVGFKKKRDHL